MNDARALIFDFDGLIIDSETPEYQAWKELYASEGVHLELGDWLNAVGYVNGFDPRAHLEKITGHAHDWKVLNLRRKERAHALVDEQPALPGVASLLEQAAKSCYKLGIASNSNASWVLPKLERLGLTHYFQVIRTLETAARPKPAPDLYLGALADLGADSKVSFAFEDSQPGIAAANAAGLRVVAVPNMLTRHQDLSLADYHLGSLEEFVLPI